VLSLLHPLTTMLFFMQDFENPPVGPATGWSHVAVHNTNPVRLCKNGEGTGKERKHPIQQFVKSFGISILHSAARGFHLDGLGAIRIPVEPSSRSPAIQVSSSTQVEQAALFHPTLAEVAIGSTNSSASVHQNHPIYFASPFSLSAPRIEPLIHSSLIFAADQPVSPSRRCRVTHQPIGRLQS
jgi:hypothetical protein